MGLDIELKPIKGFTEWVHKQFNAHYIWYRRKGYYAECHCSECGERYILRTDTTGDPFQDAAIDIEKPARDKATKCRKCGTKAQYKPAGHTKGEYHFLRIITGQKISDDKFAFAFWYSCQRTQAAQRTHDDNWCNMLIMCERGKAPERYSWSDLYGWIRGGSCNFSYIAHPSVFREIKKTGMYKYIPVPENVKDWFNTDSWIADFYIAAARYPDYEMLIKLGLDDYWHRLMYGYTTFINPRGKTIEDRLRIYKSRLKDLISAHGDHNKLFLFQLERKYKVHWTDEEIEIVEILRDSCYEKKYQTVFKYASPIRVRNYMVKQKMWPSARDRYPTRNNKSQKRDLYYDYLTMREDAGYEMNDIHIFPHDFGRRHDEMVLETEKTKLDARKKEVLAKYPKIKSKYRKLSEKYSAAAGGLIIRPAKDAAEIVSEGRILHHCVGGDNYLNKHNNGQSAILFLRKVKEKDMPYITVEVKGEEIIQWYGAYDKKPDKTLIDAWLRTYTKELTKRKKQQAKNCTGATTRRTA